jgi:excisionase family DNA binding protein
MPSPQSPEIAPLAVPPIQAAHMLGLGLSHTYKLMRTGQLQSYEEGRARRVTVASIHKLIERRLRESAVTGWRQLHNPSPHRHKQRSQERA